MGENITTRGLDILGLPSGTRLHFVRATKDPESPPEATLEVTGLRNPCYQLDDLQEGLMAAVLDRRGFFFAGGGGDSVLPQASG